MPQNTNVSITNDWTMVTDADVTAITFQNVNGYAIQVTGTNGTTAPTATGGVVYNPGQGERAVAMADLFPGVSGANRLWARVPGIAAGLVFVSHA